MADKPIFSEVTNETLRELSKYDVIMPSLYASIFSEKSVKHGVDQESMHLDEGIALALAKMRQYEAVVEKNGNALHHGLEKAHHAIVSQDLKLLDQVREEVSKLRNELVSMKKELYQDSLTKVYNRKWLFEHYTESGKFLLRGVMIFFDLNQFKQINDNYGHLIGDRVLKLFASYLKELKPGYPMRYGGDEFVLLCENQSLHACEQMIDTLMAQVKQQVLSTHKGDRFKISFAHGMVNYNEGDEVLRILEIADNRMYQAKAERK